MFGTNCNFICRAVILNVKQQQMSSANWTKSRLLYELSNYLSWSGLSDPEHQARGVVVVFGFTSFVAVVGGGGVVLFFVSAQKELSNYLSWSGLSDSEHEAHVLLLLLLLWWLQTKQRTLKLPQLVRTIES